MSSSADGAGCGAAARQVRAALAACGLADGAVRAPHLQKGGARFAPASGRPREIPILVPTKQS